MGKIVPILLALIIGLPIISCVQKRQHEAKVKNKLHYYWENQCQHIKRGWLDETRPELRGKAIPFGQKTP